MTRPRPRLRLRPRPRRARWRRYRTRRGHEGVGLFRRPTGWTVQLGRAVWTTDREVGP